MADTASGYDGEIDWEEEILAADLLALREAGVACVKNAFAAGDGRPCAAIFKESEIVPQKYGIIRY